MIGIGIHVAVSVNLLASSLRDHCACVCCVGVCIMWVCTRMHVCTCRRRRQFLVRGIVLDCGVPQETVLPIT